MGQAEQEVAAEEASERRTTIALNTAAVLAAAATPVLASQSGQTGAPRALLLGGAALCAAVVVLIGAVVQRADRRRLRTARQVAVEAEAELTEALTGALAPITSYLGELADAHVAAERSVLVGELTQATVHAAIRLAAPDGRSAFYAADLRRGLLLREAYAGRATPPRPAFRAGTPDGDAVLDLVRRGDLVVIGDVDADPMVRPRRLGTYRSVVAAAVTSGDQRLGMVTVDAPRAAAFDAIQVELVRVLANLLGAGLGQVPAAGRAEGAPGSRGVT